MPHSVDSILSHIQSAEIWNVQILSTTDDQCQSRVVQTYQIPETAKKGMQLITWMRSVRPGTSEAKPGHFGVPKTTFGIPGQSSPKRDCPGKTGKVGQLDLVGTTWTI